MNLKKNHPITMSHFSSGNKTQYDIHSLLNINSSKIRKFVWYTQNAYGHSISKDVQLQLPCQKHGIEFGIEF